MVELVSQNKKINNKLYNNAVRQIKKKIGNNYPINHVGSTALPNMYGKNIIDILIGVEDVGDLDKVTKELIDIGYCPGKNISNNVCRFFANTDEETKSGDIHIHVAIKSTERYKGFIILRDYLLENKKERQAYCAMKKKILNLGHNEREEYKRIKADYVTELLNRAMEWAKKKHI